MIHIEKHTQGDVLTLKLTGSLVSEAIPLDVFALSAFREVHVNCRELTRINSNGIRAWIKCFESLRAQGKKVVLSECSTALVQQMNTIVNFRCGADVHSVYVPFFCPCCKGELLGLYRTEDLRITGDWKMGPQKCPKCSSFAVFDDREESYFGFLGDSSNQFDFNA